MIAQKMRERRVKMEKQIRGQPSSDAEDNSTSSQTPMISAQNTNAMSAEDDSKDMMTALQTRRMQRFEEITNDDSMFGEENNQQKNILGIPVQLASRQDSGSVEGGLSRATSAGSSTLNMSIRERLRSRVKTSTTDPNTLNRKLRGLRDRALPNRFEESNKFQPVEEELDPYLQQSIATTKEWKKLKLKKGKELGFVTEEEAFQFFVGEIDEELDTEEAEKIASPIPPAVTIDMEDSFLIYNAKPAYVGSKERQEIETKLYHHPSSFPAPRESKVPAGILPRNLEEEGFYVGNAPPVSRSSLSRMENRIIASDPGDTSWFDEDGNLKRFPNPLKEQPVRPMMPDEMDLDPLLQLDWQKAQFSSLDTRYIDEQGNVHYQLDVDISNIKFSHQSLFSREHVLESQLTQLHNHYLVRKKSGLVEHLENKLEALRTALKQLNNETESIKSRQSKLLTEQHKKRTREFQLEIREIHLNKENNEIQERTLLMNLLRTWRKIKMLRESQNFVNTSVTIKVRKELTNRTDDEKNIEKEIQERLQGERALFEEQHVDDKQNYKAQLLNWKQYRKYMKRKQQKANTENESVPEIPEVLKPEPPPSFDQKETERNLREHIFQCRRKPGEAILVPELQTGAVITPNGECPRQEQVRRSAMKSAKYMIKVLFNDLEVSRTATRPLTADFSVQFGEILSIKILQWPESIKLQIYDGVTTYLLAELFAPIPDASSFSSPDTLNLDGLEFSSAKIVQYRHEGVGSGIPVDLSLGTEGEVPIIPLTSGILYIATSWGVDENGKNMAPPVVSDSSHAAISSARHYDALAALGAAGMVDLQKLLSWISHAKLDPNDPSNADIINLAKMAQMSQLDDIKGPQFFRLNQLEEETQFATKEELEHNKRFRLIKLRDQGVPELKHFQMIPTDERYISDDVFEEYEKRLNMDNEDQDEEYSQRKAVAKFLAKVRQQVHSRSQLAKRHLDLEDIVVEEDIPDIGTLGARIAQMTEPRRPLKPIRKERKKIGGQNLAAVKDVHLLINIVRAFDVPIRIDDTSMQQPTAGYNVATSQVKSLVRPFIEVMFQGNFLRTTVAEGAFPSWNEDLILPFKSPNNDYTTDSLQMVKDKIYVNLFDEVVVDMLVDDRLRPTNIHHRIEKRWLGSVEIPFSTVYFNSKVEGFLQVNSPSVLLGYKRGDKQNNLNLIQDRTLVQMFVTIEPQLQPAPPMPEKFETSENDTLVHNSQVWLSALRGKHPKREFKTMVSDIDGKKVFLTRYLYAQQPPNELILNNDVDIFQKCKLLARFVSLIPYVADSVQFPDLCDIWATSDQFLQMLAGDEEEHAVLLCNFFLWLGVKSYLILGQGIPEGSTAYVLTQEGTSHRLWNASTGESYEAQDVHSPLQSIGCLVDDTNIYGNIQSEEHPSKLIFNTANIKCWKPFFSKAYPNPGLASIQSDRLNYIPVDAQFAINLEDRLERLLRDKLMEWRPRNITKFNRYCSQAFKNLLLTIETKTVLSGASSDEHRSQLGQVLSSHQLTGFPLHMPYTDNEAVVERVFSTGVHKSEDADVEFALAVHIHPYPNSVMVVWIYIGSLIRKAS